MNVENRGALTTHQNQKLLSEIDNCHWRIKASVAIFFANFGL